MESIGDGRIKLLGKHGVGVTVFFNEGDDVVEAVRVDGIAEVLGVFFGDEFRVGEFSCVARGGARDLSVGDSFRVVDGYRG